MTHKKNPQLAILEDDKYFRYEIKCQLENDYSVLECENIQELLKTISLFNIDLAILDLALDNKDGLQGLEALKLCQEKNIKSVVLSNYDEEKMIKSSYQLGALQYFTKEKFISNCKNNIDQLLHLNQETKEINSDFPSKHQAILENQTKLQNAFLCQNKNIFIYGESGTGKNKLIQYFLNRDAVSFLEITKNFKIDEFEELPQNLYIQNIELISLETQQYFINYLKKNIVRHKIIISSSLDINSLLSKNLILPEFIYLLNIYTHKQTPLRLIPDDFMYYFEKFQKQFSKRQFFSTEALEVLKNYSWPGNFDELHFYIAEINQSSLGFIQLKNLPHKFLNQVENNQSVSIKPFLNNQSDQYLLFAKSIGLKQVTEAIEQEIVKKTLEKNALKVNKTVKELKISKSHFYRIFASINNQPELKNEIS